MIFSKAFTAVITAAGLLVQDALAHSVKRNPLSSIARIENAVIQTPSHRVHSDSSFDVSFVISTTQQTIRLVLKPNHDIFSGDATIQVLGADGAVRRVEPVERRGHRVFRGETFIQRDGESEWTHVGWSRINVRRDGDKPLLQGVFTIDQNHHHIQTKSTYSQTSVDGDPGLDDADDEYMVVWRDTDIRPSEHDDLKRDVVSGPTCGTDSLRSNRYENSLVYRSLEEPVPGTSLWQMSPRALFGRQSDMTGGNGAGINLASTIGSTQGCPTTRKVALVGIATDCTYTEELGGREAVTENVVQLVNAASQLYESTFNISLAIQNLTISEEGCPSSPPASAPWNRPCSGEFNINQRLSSFSQWRGQRQDTNAFWTLLTTCETGNAVGLAWLGAVCEQGSVTRGEDTSGSANVVVRTSTEWLVFAHEVGHTFGAVHDCDPVGCSNGALEEQACCPFSRGTCDANAQFIMNPSTGRGITQFSPCSIGNICSFLGRDSKRTNCLSDNKGVTTFAGSQCGNGIVEAGEDCDCGGEEGCAGNPCCDANTCKYTTGSVCDPANEECCTQQCGFMSNGTVCRASTGVCDPAEVCSGTSAGCPADLSAPDGDSCGNGLSCASGRCTSRDQQCKAFLGPDDATTSCSNSGCRLSCRSKRLRSDQCYLLQQYFLDGTPCEGGGRCQNGNCQGVSLWKQIVEWIENNKQISIPVFCVVGGLILLALLSCCWSCVSRTRRRRHRTPKVAAAPPPPMRGGWGGNGGGGGGYFGGGGGGFRGGGGTPPMRPGPAYAPLPTPPGPPQGYMGGGPGMQTQGDRWEPMRSRSFRYA